MFSTIRFSIEITIYVIRRYGFGFPDMMHRYGTEAFTAMVYKQFMQDSPKWDAWHLMPVPEKIATIDAHTLFNQKDSLTQ